MDGVLLEEPCQTSELHGSLDLIRELRQEVAELRAELASLRRENSELRQQVGYWKSRHADVLKRIAVLEQENEHLRGENRRLQAQLFGQKSEKQSTKDRSNHLEGLEEDKPKPDPSKPKKSPKRREQPHLPVIEQISVGWSSSKKKAKRGIAGGCGCSTASTRRCSSWIRIAVTMSLKGTSPLASA